MSIEALKAYQEGLKNGTIERPATLTPIEKVRKNPKSLRLAINAKCWDCTCGQRAEIRDCVMDDCPLYQVRPYQVKS